MARLIIIVTNKSVYPEFWDSAEGFCEKDKGGRLKHIGLGDDGAYLLAEFESQLPQPDRRREVRNQTTANLINLARHELQRSQRRGADPPEIYAAAHEWSINWARVKAEPGVGPLFRGYADFSHGLDVKNPIYGALLQFATDPRPATFDSVIQFVSLKIPVGGGEDLALSPDPVAAFAQLKHRMVKLLKYLDIDLQGLERAGFPPEYVKAVADKYKGDAPHLLDRFRESVYGQDEGLVAVARSIGAASESRRRAIDAAWAGVEKHLPERGDVVYIVRGERPYSITGIVSSVGEVAGLEEIRKTGGVKGFNAWYLALDDAFNAVRRSLDAEERAAAAAGAKAAAAAQPAPDTTPPRPGAGEDSDQALPADS